MITRLAISLMLLQIACKETPSPSGSEPPEPAPSKANHAQPTPEPEQAVEQPALDTTPCGRAVAKCRAVRKLSADGSTDRGGKLMVADAFCTEIAKAIGGHRRAKAEAEENKRYGVNYDLSSYAAESRDLTCSMMLEQLDQLGL